MQPTELPNISIIIPCLNEERHIQQCLISLIENSYPDDKLELLVIDGGSTDSTLSILEKLAEQHRNIKVLNNPKRITPAAVNIGINAASSEILIWAGAHAVYDKNYLLYSVQTLTDENCASVGGVISPSSNSIFGKAVAAATSSRFGIGNAKYRYATKQMEVDTVYGGCWRKKDVLAIAGFNETLVRNQDYEFNSRLRKHIGPIILNPDIKCQYFCRDNLKDLAKQYYQYGFWRFKSATKFGAQLTLRQLIPLAFLLGLFFSAIAISFGYNLGLFIPILYLSFIGIATVILSIKHKKLSFLVFLPLIFCTIHVLWPFGFTTAAIKKALAKRSKPEKD